MTTEAAVTIPRRTLAHWAELATVALDNGPAAIDALLELAAELEEALEATP